MAIRSCCDFIVQTRNEFVAPTKDTHVRRQNKTPICRKKTAIARPYLGCVIIITVRRIKKSLISYMQIELDALC